MGQRTFRLGLLIVVPIVALVVGVYLYLSGGRWIVTENAYVKNDIIQIGPVVQGRVVEVAVDDHAQVKEGDLLFRIDPQPFRIALSQAEAEMRTVSNRIEALRAEYRGARVDLAEAEVRARFLERQAERARNLELRGVASSVRMEEAQQELTMARDRAGSIREKMRQILANLGGELDIPAERHPMYLEARARRERAAFDLDRTTVRAPAAGTVINMRLQPGEYVEPGDTVFSIVAIEKPWIEVNLKETELTHVRVGQPAVVVADAYPDREVRAVVDTISPATGAEFAVLPPQNATGNWVKVVQRLPVRLRLLDPPEDPPLRAGMTVEARIDTGRQRQLSSLVGTGWAGGRDTKPAR